MNCRLCEETPGQLMAVQCARTASAVCVRCGVAVCSDHGRRAGPDGRVLCMACLARPDRPELKGTRHDQPAQANA